MADLLPNLENPSEQIQDILAACECIRENLESETAPNSLELLQKIETSLKESKLNILEHTKKLKSAFDLEVKANREVLFLPYKASMWDSLESIYIAAKDDPSCDALVMPIPYYDKKDGKLTEMHWEIDYPKNIPLIDWQKYNIEERHPDIIFIHNPYDDCNYVTSVHPDFYSEKLRNFTDCLVYVPYFVFANDMVENHFVTTAGCIHAHKVIVQSEKVCDSYISVFKKQFGNRFGKPADKFIALGSPKFDKVINTKKEDCQIPDEWRELIGNRKIILYNTTIGTLLQGNEQYLQKLRSVLSVFKKHKDAILWWRPHPLNEATYKSMRPRLLSEYMRIIEEYKREGWGIYDDTVDLHRAIAVSDAYYGDWSSLVALYKVTGKPMLVDYQRMDDSLAMEFLHICDDGENYWASANWYNCLLKIDKATYSIECAEHFPNEETNKPKLYTGGIAENNKKLYFAPYMAKTAVVYDIANKSFSEIKFGEIVNMNEEHRYSTVVSVGKYVVFLPYKGNAIIRYDSATGLCDYCTDWVLDMPEPINRDYGYFPGRVTVVGNKVFAPSLRCNIVFVLDVDTLRYEICQIGTKKYQLHLLTYDGKDFWILSLKEKMIFKWNHETRQVKEFSVLPYINESVNGRVFRGIEYQNGFVWLIPESGKHFLRINVITDKIEIVKDFDVCLKTIQPHEYRYFSGFGTSINKIILQENFNNTLLLLDTSTGNFQKHALTIEASDKEAIYDFYSNGIRSDLIKLINGTFPQNQDNQDLPSGSQSGKSIYNAMLGQIKEKGR
jgi:hypothetical protein